MGGPIGQAQLQALAIGDAHHVGAVVAAVADAPGRPGGPRGGGRGGQAPVAVDAGVGEAGQGRGMGQQAAQKVVSQAREPQGTGGIGEQVAALQIPEGEVGVAAVAGEFGHGLGHEAGPHALRFGQGFDHHLEKGVAIGRHQGLGEGPVHLKLAIGVLVVGLVRAPAQLLHALEQGADQGETAHQRHLVVTGFALAIVGIGRPQAGGIEQEKLGLHATAQLKAQPSSPLPLALQQAPRALLHRHAIEAEVGRHPAHLGLPGQGHQAGGIGDRHHIAIGGREIEPGGKAGKAGPRLSHRSHRRGRHQLGALHPEQIREGHQQKTEALVPDQAGEIGHGGSRGDGKKLGRAPCKLTFRTASIASISNGLMAAGSVLQAQQGPGGKV